MRLRTCLLAAAAAAVLLLTACGAEQRPECADPAASASQSGSGRSVFSLPRSASGDDEVPPEQSVPLREEPEQRSGGPVREVISQEGEVGTQWDQIPYSYHVPELTDGTETAQTINGSIQKLIGEQVKADLSLIRNGEAPLLNRVQWEAHRNGDLLSLVVETGGVVRPAEYHVYNYDVKTGEWLTSFEVLRRAGMDQLAVQSALARAVGQECNRHLMHMAVSEFGPVNQMKAESLSLENLSDARIYLEEGGKPMAAAELSVPAGAGLYDMVLPLDLNPEPGCDMWEDYGFLHAELRDNQLTLTFRDQEPAGQYLSQNVEFDRPYRVSGLYGTYVDMEICSLGQDPAPFVFLADDQGGVTFCDVLQCARAGQFFAAGPISEPGDVIGFEQGTAEATGRMALARTKTGGTVDLGEQVYRVETSAPVFLEEAAWITADGRYSLSFLNNDSLQVRVCDTADMGLAYSGTAAYLGVDEDGLHYGAALYQTNPMYEDPEDYEKYGVIEVQLTLPCRRPCPDCDGNRVLHLNAADGKTIFEVPGGDIISLERGNLLPG